MTDVPLEALLRRVSRLAEKYFDHHGEIDPMWLIESADGEQHVIVSPIVAPNALASHDYKDRLTEKMRETFRDLNVVRYARATECWTAPYGDAKMTDAQAALEYARLGYSLANHPERREIISIEAEDANELISAEREIIRPQHGKPYLGKLGAIERPTISRGRFHGLLPSAAQVQAQKEAPPEPEPQQVRFSRDLPDDVGTVFVTNVPNAPLQVMGRRDPATGELCVSNIMHPPADASPDWVTNVVLPGVEIVTGQDAELLILSMHRWLTEQAIERGLTFDEYVRRNSAKAITETKGRVTIFECTCPQCGASEGPIYIGRSFWHYCREHKVHWLAGYDFDRSNEVDAEEERRYHEIGLDEFKYLGPFAEEHERKKRERERKP
jgi:hypothetical protein